ncbi:MAG TPA: CRISPR-associated endonuclease Cas2, partial [Bacteroidetes bacterium]|nr:CRISPR-associated endonuclease Cas2 [Bacteroidota bacterium]
MRLLTYDIGDDRARTRFSKRLEFYGFERIQYSVFLGEVPAGRWKNIWKETQIFFENYCDEDDRIMSHVIERDHFDNMAILG